VPDGIITEIEKESDDNYSIEIMRNQIKHSFEIDGKTGKIISLEQEDIFLND
jgi:uncharacterized membrane protein YkoI